MVDTLALLISHGMLVLVILRLVKVEDPELPSRQPPRKLPVRTRPRA